jgi:Asp-tRNA(Asn)/Glu-tRNA(Gln) amidotransferase A subunit family amidase
VKPLSESLDTVGLLGADLSGIRKVYAAIVGSSPEPVGPFRLAFCAGPFWTCAQPGARSAAVAKIEEMRDRGLAIGRLDLPSSFVDVAAARTVHDYEMRRSLLRNSSPIAPSCTLRSPKRWSARPRYRARSGWMPCSGSGAGRRIGKGSAQTMTPC